MKKLGSILLVLVFLVLQMTGCSAEEANSETNTAAAAEHLTIVMQIGYPMMTVNGVEKEIDPGRGTSPILQNERTMLPIRAIVEEMGGAAAWDEETQTVVLALGEDVLLLSVGSQTAFVNETPQTLDAAPILMNDRTMLPIRFVAEAFGFTVLWDEADSAVTITRNPEVAAENSAQGSETTAAFACHTAAVYMSRARWLAVMGSEG